MYCMANDPATDPDEILDDSDAEEIEQELDGKLTLPNEVSKTHRRRVLAALGGAAIAGFAGCVGEEDPEPEETPTPEPTPTPDEETPTPTPEEEPVFERPDYTQIDHMAVDWAPKDWVKDLDVQVAYNDDEIRFRFEWDWDVKNGWFHDVFVYEDGEWVRYGEPNPGAPDPDYGFGDNFSGFTEDRLSFLVDDGSVKGFEQFGGWLTVHEGTRTLPGAVEGDEVEDHPHHGDVLGNDDVRKYIPQSREGEWWENDWDAVKDQEELDEMLENGEFLDMPMMRAHRGAPGGYGTVHCILDHRHGAMDEPSTRIRNSQGITDDGHPEYMFDPDVVEGGTLDLQEIYDGEVLQTDTHALIQGENMVEFDPDEADVSEGAVIPRRYNRPDEVEGPGALWRVDATWENDTWTVEMWRPLESGYAGEQDFEPGEVYDWSPAVHGGGAQRWHWVGYPYKLGLGVDPDHPHTEEAEIVAEEFDGDEPDWGAVDTYTVPLMYPGQTDWTWLTSGEHPRVDEVRNADIAIWEYHSFAAEDPEDFAARMIDLEEAEAPRK
ncbi:cytochrome c-552 [Halalkaliarchaeum desulfuricum]|uniref:Cytochrome c-552 n=2 Tax=Halalkaliarchaeum desulfuricum TaxID=2055893 RepID=A0A343TNT4_9EURY|nr:cytochrome c-552 [Halalkaliarchaeum desulfuricum]